MVALFLNGIEKKRKKENTTKPTPLLSPHDWFCHKKENAKLNKDHQQEKSWSIWRIGMYEVALFKSKRCNRDPGEESKFMASFLEKFRFNNWVQYKLAPNCQSVISDFQAVIQNFQQDTWNVLIGPSFTSPLLYCCFGPYLKSCIGQIEY